MQNNLAAQLYAAGLKVFPCTANKAPAIEKGTDWRTAAEQPPATQYWQSGIVGVPVPTGVTVIDLDLYKGVTRKEVEQKLGCPLNWDRALIQRTQSGGEHYAFAVDWPVKQGTNVAGVKGFDTRTAGDGYIATGAGYTPYGFGVFALAQPHGLPRLPRQARAVLERVEPPPRPAVSLPAGDKDIDTIRDALRHLNPECSRDDWRDVGFALRHHFHDDPETGLLLFDEWSRGALTEDGQEPHNYVAEHMDHQWFSFKPEGSTTSKTIGHVFSQAILKGWKAPWWGQFDTAAAFGGNTATKEQYDELIDRITEHGGDPKNTNELIESVRTFACNELQRGMLLAALHRELKDAGLLTRDVKAHLQGSTPATSSQLAAPGEYGKNHTQNAAVFIDRHYPDGQLTRSEQVWYKYNGKVWQIVEDEQIKHEVAIALAPSMPQHSVVSGTYNMIECLTPGAGEKVGKIDPSLILMQNGVLNINTGQLTAHSREYFTTNILPYNYNPAATAPTWETFLQEVFEYDFERIALLQEWFGYLMTSTYEHQKIMLLLGPTRSGKGTIGRVLKLLVGEENYSAGTLTAFAKDSYLESLRTKTVVFVGDAAKNIPRNTVDAVTERLKGISGCDDQTFERKYRSTLTEPLPCRITLSANNVPRLFDDSGALASRLLVLPFNVSWLNREDPGLFDRLAAEIEGIAVWALEGVARLRSNGRFTMPEASKAEAEYIQEAYSPLQNFLASACGLNDDSVVSATEVYETYRAWALATGEDSILSRRPFISSFKDLVRGTGAVYTTVRPAGGSPVKGFRGLTLKEVQSQPTTHEAFKVVK